MVAQFCEGRGWRCWQEFTMSSKFRGKYLQVIPLGIAHLEFNGSGKTLPFLLYKENHLVKHISFNFLIYFLSLY